MTDLFWRPLPGFRKPSHQTRIMNAFKSVLRLLTALLLAPLPLHAWGDAHRVITLAALEIIQEKDRWIARSVPHGIAC